MGELCQRRPRESRPRRARLTDTAASLPGSRLPAPRPAAHSEDGYILIAVLFLAFLMLLSLAIAAPKVAVSIQRDKEEEAIHRGEQYRRAIQLYYRQFGRYPTSIDQLENTNQIRFLRKRYADPLTGKNDWKPVLFGQAHVHPLGFFGQPLISVGGVGIMNSAMYAAPALATDANGLPVASNDSSDDEPAPSAGVAAPAGASSLNSPDSGGFGSAQGGDESGGTMGSGGPIVGMTLSLGKPSLISYRQQTRYNKWEFNYDPAADIIASGIMPPANAAPAQGTPTNGAPGFTSPSADTSQPAPGANSDSSQSQ